MTDIEEVVDLIRALKNEIRHKAREAGLSFDEEDIEHIEVDGHYVIALTKIKQEHTVMENGELISYTEKVPVLWAEYPPVNLMTYEELELGSFKISMPVPRVCCRIPWLIYLIFPDGTYKTGDEPLKWLSAPERWPTYP